MKDKKKNERNKDEETGVTRVANGEARSQTLAVRFMSLISAAYKWIHE